MRGRLGAILLFCFAVSMPLTASAQYGGDLSEVEVKGADAKNTNVIAPGDKVTVKVTKLLPKTRHDILFSQSPWVEVGNGTSNANGVLNATFTVPAEAETGPARVKFDPQGVDGYDTTITIQVVRDVAVQGEDVTNPQAAAVLPTDSSSDDDSNVARFAIVTALLLGIAAWGARLYARRT